MKARGGFAIERRDGLFSAFDRPPQGVIGKVSRVEKFVQKLVRSVLDHLHFFDDHFLLALQIVLAKRGLATRSVSRSKACGSAVSTTFRANPVISWAV